MPTKTKPEKLSLEKELYQEANSENKSFTQKLEEKDPSSQYKGSPMESLDAFERQLAAHEIKLSGVGVSRFEEFYRTPSSRALVPEWIDRQIRIGLGKGRIMATINDVVGTTNTIDSDTARTLEVDLDNSDATLKRVAEGGEFSKSKFSLKENPTKLFKVGTQVDVTYEAIKFTKLNVLASAFQLIGQKFGRDMTFEAIDVLINGDGSGNPAPVINVANAGQIVYEDLLNLIFSFENFEPDYFAGTPGTIKKLLGLPEYKNPLVVGSFLTDGKVMDVLGNTLKTNRRMPSNMLVAYNKQAGVQMYQTASSNLTEVDKWIDRQIQGTVISRFLGFSKMFKDSAYVLKF